MLVRTVSLSAVCLLLGGGILFADTPLEPYTPPVAPPPLDPVGALIRLGFMMAITCLVCGAGVLWARRLGQQNRTTGQQNGRMLHEGTLALDRRSAIHAIRVDGQQVIVAIDATGLKSLTLISEPFENVLAEEVAETTGTAGRGSE
jgi:hypothetical protein